MNELSKNNTKLCIKPVIGEGASGFRIIDNDADTIPFIFNTASSQKISYETALKNFTNAGAFPGLNGFGISGWL